MAAFKMRPLYYTVLRFEYLSSEEEEAITSSSHIRLIRWTQPVSRNRSRNTNESQ